MSVSMISGATAFSVMPRGPSSLASDIVNNTIAASPMALAISLGNAIWLTPKNRLITRSPSANRASSRWVRKGASTRISSGQLP